MEAFVVPMDRRKDGSVEELGADALHVEIHQGGRQRRCPEEGARLFLPLHLQSVQRRQEVGLLLLEAEDSEERCGERVPVRVAKVGQSPDDLELRVEEELLERRVFFFRHDQVVQVPDLETQGPPLADGGDPGEVVPVLRPGPALEAAHVDGDLGNLVVLGRGSLASVHHRDSEGYDIRRDIAAKDGKVKLKLNWLKTIFWLQLGLKMQ